MSTNKVRQALMQRRITIGTWIQIGHAAVAGFAYKNNWLYLSQYITYFIPLAIVLLVIIPFYRRNRISTVYEYLERRFGSWARVYTALIGILTLTFYIGTVLYTISLPIEVATALITIILWRL